MQLKVIFLIILFSFSCDIHSQEKTCNCEKYDQYVDCKKHYFSNKASIHWEYNCENGKLIFEHRKIKKELFQIETDFIQRIGYQFAHEYDDKILFTYRWISGCCEPLGFYLHDKNSGKIVLKIDKGIVFSEDKKSPYLVYLSKDYNKIILLNVNSLKTIQYSLPKNKIQNTIRNSDEQIAEFLFDENKFETGYFKTTFRYFENNKWIKNKILIKLN